MILHLTLLLGMISFAKGSTKNRRDICSNTKLTDDYKKCANKVFQDYKTALINGDDGRPDWAARISCNYMASAIDVCWNILLTGDCLTLEEVNAWKDLLISIVLENLEESVVEWDSAKCPTTITYFEPTGQKLADKESVDELSPAQYSEALCVKDGGGYPAEEGDTIVEGCVRKTCKSGVWRPSLEKLVCCHNNEAFQPQSIISTTSSPDGCFTASIECVLEDNAAKTLLKTKRTCGKPSTKEEVDNLKGLIERYLEIADSCNEI